MSDNLPPEILTQVFLHLSIKTLARLTSVCKYWHSLISSPVFISLHSTARRNSPATTPLLLTWRGPYKDCVKDRLTLHLDDGDGVCELMELECMFGSWRRLNIVRLVGSCNGLVCLFVNDFKERMILWNPRINKIVHVPKPNRGCTYGGKVFLGFGFHPAESDYKVVRVVYRKTDGALLQPHFPPPPDIEVYSLNSGAWRGGGSSGGAAQARGSYSSYSSSQAFVNGAVHWLVSNHQNAPRKVLKFDVGSEELGEMQLPEEACVAGKRNALTVVCGSKLGFMQYGLRNWDCKCDVWVMECYGVGESWRKLFSLNLEGFLGEPRLPLGFRINGDLLLATADSELASLEPDTGRFSQLGIFGDPICVDTSYVETLALINREESSSRTS